MDFTVLLGRKGHWETRFKIMDGGPTPGTTHGVPDLLLYDEATNRYFVWEVKSTPSGAAETTRGRELRGQVERRYGEEVHGCGLPHGELPDPGRQMVGHWRTCIAFETALDV